MPSVLKAVFTASNRSPKPSLSKTHHGFRSFPLLQGFLSDRAPRRPPTIKQDPIMSYRDPYSEQPGRFQSHNHYNEAMPDYNPYSTTQPPHQTYDHGEIGPSYDGYGNAYRDEPQYNQEYPPRRGPSQRTFAGRGVQDNGPYLDTSASKENGFDPEEFATPRGERYTFHTFHGNPTHAPQDCEHGEELSL